MCKVTAQQGWQDIYRRFISMIFVTKISYLINISYFLLMKISARQSTRRQTNWATKNWAIAVGQLGDNAFNIFTRFVHAWFVLVNLCWGLATIHYCLVLVLRNTKCIIQLIVIISRYCGDNYVLNIVNFSLYLRLYNILKYFRQLFKCMGKVTAQQAWHDMYRQFYAWYLQQKYYIWYKSNFSLMKISVRQWTRRQTNWATINRAIGVGQPGDHTPQYFTRFTHVFILVNSYWGLMFVVLWQTSMNALIITETVTHRRSARTRLEASRVPVLADILATGSPAQVFYNCFIFYLTS